MYKKRLLLVMVLVVAVGLSGCSSLLSFFRKPATLEVKPGAEVEVAVDAEVELEAVLKDKKGKEVTVKAADIKWTIEDVEEAEGSTDETEEPGPVAKLSAATGKKVKVTGLRVGKATVTVAYDKLEATVTVTVAEPEPVLPLVEDIEVDKDTFFSAAYKSLPSDPDKPLYHITASGDDITFDNGTLKLLGARFTIGMPADHKSTAEISDVDDLAGELDLSEPWKITIVFTEAGRTDSDDLSGKDFYVYLDNNTTSSSNTPHSFDSRIVNLSMAQLVDLIDEESGVGVIEKEFTEKGTAKSFLQFRTESNSYIVIESFTIEYVEQ